MPKMNEEFKVTIPFPQATSHVHRGHFTTHRNVPHSVMTSVRIPREELAVIKDVAAAHELSTGEFIKWVAYYAALAIRNEDHLKTFKEENELDTSGYE